MWRPSMDVNNHHYRLFRERSDTGFLPGIKSSQKMKDDEISHRFAEKLRRCSSNLRGWDRNKQWKCCKFTKEADEMGNVAERRGL